jgi:SSS family solute:Na+ symporter
MLVKLAIIVGYLAVLTAVGLLARRRAAPGAEGFFLANRALGPVLLLLTMAATNFSAFTVLGFAGMGYRVGWSYYPIMAFGTGFMALAFLFLGVPIRAAGQRLGAVSPAELIGLRFRSPALRIAFLVVMVVFTLPYLAIQPMGAGYALEGLLGIPYQWGAILVTAVVVGYVLLGGMRGVVWTDALQGLLMLAALVVIFVGVAGSLGGFEHANKVAYGRHLRLFMRPGGDAMLMPKIWFSYMLLWLLCDPLFPQVFQRFMAAKDDRSLRVTALLYPLVCGGLFFLPIGIGVMGRLVVPGLEGAAADQVLPLVVKTVLPGWLGAVAIAAALAGLMSTMDSQLLTLGSMVSRDLLGRDSAHSRGTGNGREKRDTSPFAGGPEMGGSVPVSRLWPERLAVVGLAVVGLVFALRPVGTILQVATETFTGLAVLFPLLVAAVYWRRANPWAGLASVVTGEALVVLYHFRLLPTFGFLPAIPAVAASALVLVTGSLLFPRRDLEPFARVSRAGLVWAGLFGFLFLLSMDVWSWRQAIPMWGFLPGWLWHSISLIVALFLMFALYLRTRGRSAEEFFIRPGKRDLFRKLRYVGFKRYFYGGAYHPEPREEEPGE